MDHPPVAWSTATDRARSPGWTSSAPRRTPASATTRSRCRAAPGLPRRATIDQQAVLLPTGDVEVSFGTGHTYSFPRVVVGGRGGAYLTREPAFTGPVAGNITVTATYRTMAKVVAAEVAAGHVDAKAQKALRTSWAKARVRLAKGQADRARTALERYADDVRHLSGKHVDRPTARQLLEYAQLVFAYVDGKGTV
jgi:hypothetical protein